MQADFYKRLEDKLNEFTKWPSLYMYKFIVPKNKETKVKSLFQNTEFLVKKSSKGNYVSVTAKVVALNADEIISKYKEASQIEGIICL